MGAQKANTVEGSNQKQPVTSSGPEQPRCQALRQLPGDLGGGRECVSLRLWPGFAGTSADARKSVPNTPALHVSLWHSRERALRGSKRIQKACVWCQPARSDQYQGLSPCSLPFC